MPLGEPTLVEAGDVLNDLVLGRPQGCAGVDEAVAQEDRVVDGLFHLLGQDVDPNLVQFLLAPALAALLFNAVNLPGDGLKKCLKLKPLLPQN